MGNTYDGYDAGVTAWIVGLLVIVFAVGFLFVAAVYVVSGIAFMRLFRKTGVEPWAAWVPFFSTWRLLELGGQPGWIALLSLVPFGSYVTIVFECIAGYHTGIAFRKSGAWVVLLVFLPFVWAFLLSAQSEVYEPDLVRQAGYGPPLVGFGSARGPYVPSAAAPAA